MYGQERRQRAAGINQQRREVAEVKQIGVGNDRKGKRRKKREQDILLGKQPEQQSQHDQRGHIMDVRRQRTDEPAQPCRRIGAFQTRRQRNEESQHKLRLEKENEKTVIARTAT